MTTLYNPHEHFHLTAAYAASFGKWLDDCIEDGSIFLDPISKSFMPRPVFMMSGYNGASFPHGDTSCL